MSALFTSLENLTKLHVSLLKLAKTKTDVIKKGDIDTLNKILKEEEKHISAIDQLEKVRQAETAKLIPGHEPTLSALIETADESDRALLTDLQHQLIETMVELKEQNILNQELIQQSMQFVQLSMDLLNPQPQNLTYGRGSEQKKQPTTNRSIFDSKA